MHTQIMLQVGSAIVGSLAEWIGQQAAPFLLMASALWWMNKRLTRAEQRYDILEARFNAYQEEDRKTHYQLIERNIEALKKIDQFLNT